MNLDDIEKQIQAGTERARKTYGFNNSHDSKLPAGMWFQESHEGLVLFIVFYTMACRWSSCLGCNLPSLMSSNHIPFNNIMAQIDAVFDNPEVLARRDEIDKVIVSNNGSVLDQDTFSSTALMYLVAKLNITLPGTAVLSLETRPEYVDVEELEFISRALGEASVPAQLEIAVGFEAFDEKIRNRIFNKGLSFETYERLVEQMSPYGYRLKCYFMQKPVPGMSDAEAVQDIRNAIDYLSEVSKRFNIDINMHLNPTYVAAGTILEQAFNEEKYSPPLLNDVADAVLHAEGKDISIFVGLSDEGLAVGGGSFVRPGDELIVAALEHFNRTQDYAELARKRSET